MCTGLVISNETWAHKGSKGSQKATNLVRDLLQKLVADFHDSKAT